MSVTISTDIFCDYCSCWDSAVTVSGINAIRIRQARKKAKQQGWLYKKGKDICPECQEIVEHCDKFTQCFRYQNKGFCGDCDQRREDMKYEKNSNCL